MIAGLRASRAALSLHASALLAVLAGGAAPRAPREAPVASVARARPDGDGGDRRVEIRLNGRRLLDGIAVGSDRGESVFVPVDGLARSIDGTRPQGPARLRVDGPRLWAAALGGCEDCRIHVARTVVLSTGVRALEGGAVIPLADLVAALEGRLERDGAPASYAIHAGKCTWCILEAR